MGWISSRKSRSTAVWAFTIRGSVRSRLNRILFGCTKSSPSKSRCIMATGLATRRPQWSGRLLKLSSTSSRATFILKSWTWLKTSSFMVDIQPHLLSILFWRRELLSRRSLGSLSWRKPLRTKESSSIRQPLYLTHSTNNRITLLEMLLRSTCRWVHVRRGSFPTEIASRVWIIQAVMRWSPIWGLIRRTSRCPSSSRSRSTIRYRSGPRSWARESCCTPVAEFLWSTTMPLGPGTRNRMFLRCAGSWTTQVAPSLLQVAPALSISTPSSPTTTLQLRSWSLCSVLQPRRMNAMRILWQQGEAPPRLYTLRRQGRRSSIWRQLRVALSRWTRLRIGSCKGPCPPRKRKSLSCLQGRQYLWVWKHRMGRKSSSPEGMTALRGSRWGLRTTTTSRGTSSKSSSFGSP